MEAAFLPLVETRGSHAEFFMESKKQFHEIVAEKLIDQLKAGTAPWQKPWEPGDPNAYFPMNPTTGKRYKGINSLFLMAQGHSDVRWMTYKQAADAGAQVRKGEKGTLIQCWKFSEEQNMLDENGQPVLDANGKPFKESILLERPRVYFATVFNGEQIDGLPPIQPKTEQTWSAVERAEQIINASGATITHVNGNRAFYRPSTDSIALPERGQFSSPDRYYATALHELGHWTGHSSRLNRDLSHPFGSEGYAREELRAEIASMMIGDELGIGHDPSRHAAYVGSWIKALQEEPKEVFRAAADAEKIHSHILALEQKQVLEQNQAQRQSVENREVTMEAQNAYQAELGRLLAVSTITPGNYTPSDAVKEGTHAAVFVDDVPVILCGPSDDPASVAQAEALASNAHAQAAFRAAGKNGEVRSGVIAGNLIEWRGNEAAVVSKPSGQIIGASGEDGPLVAIVLNDLGHALATKLCVTTATARIFDANAPELDNGLVLSALARSVEEKEKEDIILAAKENPITAGVAAEIVQAIANEGRWGDQVWPMKQANVYASLALQDLSEGKLWFAADSLFKAAEIEDESEAVDTIGPSFTTCLVHAQEIRDNQQIVVTKEAERQYINVPFKEKDEAKQLGARWDRKQQSWYVPEGVDPTLFAKWTQGTTTENTEPHVSQQAPVEVQSDDQKVIQTRQYLAVPYAQRNEAKAAGALWDNTAKSWYAGPKADMAKLERWKPENVKEQQGPAITPREEFAEAMRSIGLFTGINKEGDHPIMDGKRHRVPVEGGKKGAIDGFYVGHLDGHPAGRIINNKTGADITWKSKCYTLSTEEKAKLQTEAAEKLAQRDAEQERIYEATAERASKLLNDPLGRIVPIEERSTPYLQAKGIHAHRGVFADKEHKTTCIPAFDVDGKVWTMQFIDENGKKRFMSNGKKEGCFHPIGGMDALASAPRLLIAEGYATAAQLAMACGHATVAAFDSGNLEAVAKALHAKYPSKQIIIAGDDDRHLVLTHGHNPGREKAEAAAQAVGGKAIFPTFAAAENTYPSDLPAITPDSYKMHLRAEQRLADAAASKVKFADGEEAKLKTSMLSDAQLAALNTMKKHTDFDDFVKKSQYGLMAVQRQVSAVGIAMSQELRAHGEDLRAQLRKKQQQPDQRQRRTGRI